MPGSADDREVVPCHTYRIPRHLLAAWDFLILASAEVCVVASQTSSIARPRRLLRAALGLLLALAAAA